MSVYASRSRALAAVVLLMACGNERAPAADSAQTSTVPTTAPAPWTTSFIGVGAIRAGQSRATAAAILGDSVQALGASNERCGYLRSTHLAAGVKLMLRGDTVVRIDVDSGAVRTVEGAGVGDSESRVLAMYAGRVTTQPHKYTGPKGHYLVVDDPADSVHRMLFETDGAVVTKYRTGERAAVDLVEGCG